MNVLYIGNKNKKNSNNPTGLDTLSIQLSEFLNIKTKSEKKNKIFRMIDMIFAILANKKSANYVLIDTYSGKGFYFALICSLLCLILNMKYILILRGGNLEHRLKSYSFLSRMLFTNSYLNIAPSLFMKEIFKNYGFNTRYIPNNINISKYKFQSRVGFDAPKLLWLRSFHKIYNPVMAIHVLKNVLEKYENAQLCMVGPEKDNTINDCKELVNKLGITDKVIFTGKLEKNQWVELSKDFNIFINTTNIDNLPVSVLEVMALGIPIVSTNAGGLKYLLNNNSDSLLVNKNDIDGMSNNVIRIFENSDLSKKLSNNGLKKALQFDWSNSKNLWKEVFFEKYN